MGWDVSGWVGAGGEVGGGVRALRGTTPAASATPHSWEKGQWGRVVQSNRRAGCRLWRPASRSFRERRMRWQRRMQRARAQCAVRSALSRARCRVQGAGCTVQGAHARLVLRRNRIGADVGIPVHRQLANHRCGQAARKSGQQQAWPRQNGPAGRRLRSARRGRKLPGRCRPGVYAPGNTKPTQASMDCLPCISSASRT